MPQVNYGGHFDLMDFPQYRFQEFPKHVKDDMGKDLGIANSVREEMAIRAATGTEDSSDPMVQQVTDLARATAEKDDEIARLASEAAKKDAEIAALRAAIVSKTEPRVEVTEAKTEAEAKATVPAPIPAKSAPLTAKA